MFDKLLPCRKWQIQNLGSGTKFFNTDDEVYFKVYRNGKQDWKQGNIIERLGNVMYKATGSKYEHKRLCNQFKKRYIKNEEKGDGPMNIRYGVFEVPEQQGKAELIRWIE